jgi:hypothetical protein
VPRPAVLLSDGISETQKLPNGQLKQFAHLSYGTADPGHALLGHDVTNAGVGQRQTHETTAPWDPTGQPHSWHLDGECPHLTHPRRANESTESP